MLSHVILQMNCLSNMANRQIRITDKTRSTNYTIQLDQYKHMQLSICYIRIAKANKKRMHMYVLGTVHNNAPTMHTKKKKSELNTVHMISQELTIVKIRLNGNYNNNNKCRK